MQTPSSSSSATEKSTEGKELSGVVKKVDKDKQSLKIESSAGTEQELKVPSSAMITLDGSTAALDQLKAGDEVRASFDPSSHQATKLEVTSKSSSSKTGTTGETKTETKSETKSK
jgi:Cu/Ag efflux protein CusF